MFNPRYFSNKLWTEHQNRKHFIASLVAEAQVMTADVTKIASGQGEMWNTGAAVGIPERWRLVQKMKSLKSVATGVNPSAKNSTDHVVKTEKVPSQLLNAQHSLPLQE
jgi:hypothetical protein